MVLPQAMAWVQYWFRVLSLKFCGKSKKICGDISQQSPAFCMYGFVTFIFLPTTQPLFPLDTSCVIFFCYLVCEFFIFAHKPLLLIETICFDYKSFFLFGLWSDIYIVCFFSPTRQPRLSLETICNRKAKTNLLNNRKMGTRPLKKSLLLWPLKNDQKGVNTFL